MNFFHYMNTNTYSWIGPTFFVIMILAVFIIGCINGIRTSLYFGAMNLFGYAVALLVALLTFKKLVNIIPGQISIMGEKIDFSSIINSTEETIKAYVVTIITLTNYFIFLFISFFIYWFLRKRLKRKMFEYKKTNKSLIPNRILGGTISLLYMMPFITSGTSILSLLSKENAFTNLNGYLNATFSFNQVKDLRGKTIVIYQTVESAKQILEVPNAIQAIFGAASKNDGKTALNIIMKNKDTTREALKFLLTNDTVLNHLSIIKILSPQGISNVHLDVPHSISYQAPPNSAISISQNQLDKLQMSLSNLINGWNNSTANPEVVGKILINSGILKII